MEKPTIEEVFRNDKISIESVKDKGETFVIKVSIDGQRFKLTETKETINRILKQLER